MTDFKVYAAQHAKLFPLADLDSQIDKLADAETTVAIDNEVARKWQINLGRTWKFDPATKKYQHTGIDGNE